MITLCMANIDKIDQDRAFISKKVSKINSIRNKQVH